MQILHISDTHGFHGVYPMNMFDDIDLVIHSGDEANWRDPYRNSVESLNFIEWYKNVPVKNKIFIAGNHSTAIEKRLVTPEFIKEQGIIYLEHEMVEVDGLNIFGSPYTPTFGEWSFMKNRDKISRLWEQVKGPIDIFVTHGPPKGIRDLSLDRANNLEQCGDHGLLKAIRRLTPKLVCFGHIHNTKGVMNQGISIQEGITFSNAACVTDGRFDLGLTSYGNKINYYEIQKETYL